ncbi:Putative Zinc finger, RING-type, IBR domain-containing protein [Septoria linicola]|uniref:Zinc finger, RING-type, IBR domain-containing protein n=1 Tax=Septoria linicola TaxID=215465 RepID=A0A9Q9B2M9_9PEZI|nr:putative Zinc finger, RING-type, IBR domain-containing protein [Septoria linicola]USW57070.1 Putative Zinc finger, RING-type, IBR domain-containing protein [Septoria linicola]
MRQAHKSEEDASDELLSKTSKKCPECETRIVKEGGCEAMECDGCGHIFCWLCLGDYSMIEMEGSSHHGTDCPFWREPGVYGPQHIEGVDTVEDALEMMGEQNFD